MNSIQDKKKDVQEKLAALRKRLEKIKDDRKREIGDLAVKAGLEEVDNEVLLAGFKKIAEEIARHD